MKKVLMLGVIIMIFHSCKKDSNESQVDPIQKIKGNVILPVTSDINVNTLKVGSTINEVIVSNGRFEVETNSLNFNTSLLFNTNGDVLMMGYTFPNSTSNDITSKSTALALIMNIPNVALLSPEGKKNIISNVLSDPRLNETINVIEDNILEKKSLFDTSNHALAESIQQLFQRVIVRPLGEPNPPILINIQGTKLIFTNNAKAFRTKIGIYKDNQLIKDTTMPELKIVPSSVNEALDGLGEAASDPISIDYFLPSDGEYNIKIRTGKPGMNDGSVEYSYAFYENLALSSYNMLSTFIPSLPSTETSCGKAIVTNIVDKIKAVTALNTSSTFSSLLYSVNILTFSTANTLISNCAIEKINKNFFQAISKYLNFIDKTFSIIGEIGNRSVFAYQWSTTDAAIDTCFKANQNVIRPCADYPSLSTNAASSITNSTAITGGNITNEGGTQIISRGVCWSTAHAPTITDNTTTDGTGTGSYTSLIIGLLSNTTYYARAYATNTAGTAYGNEVSFTTAQNFSYTRTISFNWSNGQSTNLTLHFNVTNGTVTGTFEGVGHPALPPPCVHDISGTINGSQMDLILHWNNGIQNGPTSYNVDEKYTVSGTTDNSLSFYNATVQLHIVTGQGSVQDLTGTATW